jgi:hypothetical protein
LAKQEAAPDRGQLQTLGSSNGSQKRTDSMNDWAIEERVV